MPGTKIFNSDLNIDGSVTVSTVPNATGTLVTWNSSSKTLSTRTNAQVISDLGLATTSQLSGYIPTSHPANGITSTMITNWTTAHGWGDFRVYGLGIKSDHNSDANIARLKDNGFYTLGVNALNRPSSISSGYASGILTISETLARRFQISTGGNAEKLFFRRFEDNTPGSWRELYHTGNLLNVSQLTNDSGYLTSSTLPNPSLVTSTSATGTTNVATTNTNTYMNIVFNGGSIGSSSQITGSGSVTVTSDTNGKITITGTNTTYGTETLANLNTGTSTTGLLQSAKNLNDWLNGKNFLASESHHIYEKTCYNYNLGHLIKTDIPVNLPTMIVMKITGNSYNANLSSGTPIDTIIQCYNYPNAGGLSIINLSGVNRGYKLQNIYAFHYDGVVYFHVPFHSNYQSFEFELITGNQIKKKIVSVSNLGVPTSDVTNYTLIPLTGLVKETRTITINGTTQDLSENRTWTIPTYTAGTLAVLNTGTSTTDSVWSAKVLNDWLVGKGYATTSQLANYITTNTTQTGLTGNKTTAGKWTFNDLIVIPTGYVKGQDDGAYTNHAIRIGGNYRDEMVFYEYGSLWRFVKSQNGVNTDIVNLLQGAATFNNPGVSGVRIDTSSANGGFIFSDPGGDNIIQLRPYSLYLAHGDYGNVNFTLEDNLPMFKYGNYNSQGGQVFLPDSGSTVLRTLAVGATNGSSTVYSDTNGIINISSLVSSGTTEATWSMLSTQTTAVGYQDIEISLTNALVGTIVVELTSSWYGSPAFGLIRLEGGFGLGIDGVWNSDLRVTFATDPLRTYYKIDNAIIYNPISGKHYIRIHKRFNADLKVKALVKIIDAGGAPVTGVSIAFGSFVTNSGSGSGSIAPNYGLETGQGTNFISPDFTLDGSIRFRLDTGGLIVDGYSTNGYYSEGYSTSFTASIEEGYIGMYDDASATGYALYKNTKGYSTLMVPDTVTTPRTLVIGINQNGNDVYANSDGIVTLTTSVSNTTFTNNTHNNTTAQNQTVTLTNTTYPRLERIYYGATTCGTLTINKYSPVDGDEILVHGRQCAIVIKKSSSANHTIYSPTAYSTQTTVILSNVCVTNSLQSVHLRYMANYQAWVVLSSSLGTNAP